MQVLIILTDDKTYLSGLPDGEKKVMGELAELKAKEVSRVITVAFGPHADLRQLKNIENGADVLHFGQKEKFRLVGKGLLHRKCPKKNTR